MRIHLVSAACVAAMIGCSAGSGSLGPNGAGGSGDGGQGAGQSGGGGAGGGVGAAPGFGGGNNFIPTEPIGSGSGGSGGECAGVTNAAEKREGGKADIIFVLDNSGSMFEEANAVQTNMNNFSQLIRASQIDANVVVISAGAPPPAPGCDPDPVICGIQILTGVIAAAVSGNGVCIDPPLGLPGACPNGDDTNIPGGYMHWRVDVGSNDALVQVQNTFPNWQTMLRPDAATTFVVVTDDNANAPPTAADFAAWVDSQPVFASSIWRFSGVFCSTSNGNCAATGSVYQELVSMTGGIAGDLANFNVNTIDTEFATVFNSLATAVIADAVPVQCEWVIPPPPDGETLDPDKVNVRFSTATQGEQLVYGVPQNKCPPASDFLAWHYDDPANPQRLIACPDTCPILQADDTAVIDVQFGCDTEEPPLR